MSTQRIPHQRGVLVAAMLVGLLLMTGATSATSSFYDQAGRAPSSPPVEPGLDAGQPAVADSRASSNFTAAGRQVSPAETLGWVTLMAEDFEGTFPHSPWHIGPTGGPYLWGQRSCNPHGGTYSMWGGGGGTLGSQIPCSGQYAPGFATTLSYGPFDLRGCADLRLNFAHWTQLGAGDSLGVGYSIDGGTAWHIVPIYGDAVSICGGWCTESFYQNRWTITLCGQPKVYLLFRFASNANGVSYGSFVDDVSLEAFYAGVTQTPTATATATATRTTTPTATRTPTAGERLYLPLILR